MDRRSDLKRSGKSRGKETEEDLFPNSKRLFEELTQLFMDCQPNCAICEGFIREMTRHIRRSHSPDLDDGSSASESDNQIHSLRSSPRTRVKVNYNEEKSSEADTEIQANREVKIEVLDDPCASTNYSEIESFLEHEDTSPTEADNFQSSVDKDPWELEDDNSMNYDYEVDVDYDPEKNTEVGKSNKPVKSQEKSNPQPKKKMNQSHTCSICQVVYPNRSKLLAHFTSTHPDASIKPYACTVCDNKTFESMKLLGDHCRNVHTKLKTFACDLCDMRFKTKYQLSSHSSVHSGERPFVCEFCARKFAKEIFMKYHIKATHTQEKPFKCEHEGCGLGFVTRSRLNEHSKTHGGIKRFGCDLCDKKFHQRRALNIHQRTHTKEKPFMCEFCSKTFSIKRFMNKHIAKGKCNGGSGVSMAKVRKVMS